MKYLPSARIVVASRRSSSVATGAATCTALTSVDHTSASRRSFAANNVVCYLNEAFLRVAASVIMQWRADFSSWVGTSVGPHSWSKVEWPCLQETLHSWAGIVHSGDTRTKCVQPYPEDGSNGDIRCLEPASFCEGSVWSTHDQWQLGSSGR